MSVRVDVSAAARLRDLPSVDAVLSSAAASVSLERYGRAASVGAIRAALGEARQALRAGSEQIPGADDIAAEAAARLGLVVGARAPVMLTSRADNDRARLASCALASLYEFWRREGRAFECEADTAEAAE